MASEAEIAKAISQTLSKELGHELRQIIREHDSGALGKSLESTIETAGKSVKQMQRDLNKFKKHAAELGPNTKDLTAAQKDLHKEYKKNIEVLEHSIEISKERARIEKASSGSTSIFSDGLDAAQNKLLSWASGFSIMAGLTKTVDDFRMSLQMGGELDYLQSTIMGISQQTFQQIQKDFAVTSSSYADGLDGFMNEVTELQHGLFAYTGSLEEAARVGAEFIKMSRTVGAGLDNFGKITAGLDSSFKELNSLIGMTSEEFVNFHKSMLDSETVNKDLFRLNEDQRAQYINQNSVLLKNFTAQGFAAEQATELAKRFREMQGETAKDRLKRAVKARAMAAATGTEFSEEAFQGFLKGAKGSKEEQEAAKGTMGAISKGFEDLRGEGFSGNLIADTLDERLGGLGTDFRAFNDELVKGQKQDPTGKRQDVRDNTMINFAADMLGKVDLITELLVSGPAMIVGGIMAQTAALIISDKVGLVGLGIALAGAAALAAGVAVGGMINDYIEKNDIRTWDDVYDEIEDFSNTTVDYWARVISDMGDGIVGMWDSAMKSISEKVDYVKDWFKDTLLSIIMGPIELLDRMGLLDADSIKSSLATPRSDKIKESVDQTDEKQVEEAAIKKEIRIQQEIEKNNKAMNETAFLEALNTNNMLMEKILGVTTEQTEYVKETKESNESIKRAASKRSNKPVNRTPVQN